MLRRTLTANSIVSEMAKRGVYINIKNLTFITDANRAVAPAEAVTLTCDCLFAYVPSSLRS
jgi:hypothetical protein